jgi:hypothetical protein
MARLLAGNPKHTDGRLTKTNLGREAGRSGQRVPPPAHR